MEATTTALAPVGAHEAALAPRTFDEAQRFAETVSRSSFIPDAYRNKPGDVLACIIAGHELGIGPMQALRSIHVVKGKPILSADLMIGLVKRQAECLFFRLAESTTERCTYETQRRGDPEPTRLTWTMEDARRARLTGNQTWSAHPAAMLRARCGSALARAVYPDLVMGIYEETEGEEIAARVASAPARTVEAPSPPARRLTPVVDADVVDETPAPTPTPKTPAQALFFDHARPAGIDKDAFAAALDAARAAVRERLPDLKGNDAEDAALDAVRDWIRGGKHGRPSHAASFVGAEPQDDKPPAFTEEAAPEDDVPPPTVREVPAGEKAFREAQRAGLTREGQAAALRQLECASIATMDDEAVAIVETLPGDADRIQKLNAQGVLDEMTTALDRCQRRTDAVAATGKWAERIEDLRGKGGLLPEVADDLRRRLEQASAERVAAIGAASRRSN